MIDDGKIAIPFNKAPHFEQAEKYVTEALRTSKIA